MAVGYKEYTETNTIMKRIAYIIIAALAVISCGKNEDTQTLEQSLCNEWHSTSLTIQADIYLDFNSDKTFEMFQQIGQGAYRLYRGTWKLDGDVLSGKYNDGESWAAKYKISVSGNVLKMLAENCDAEESEFASATIPAKVRENCVVEVKSEAATRLL